MVKLLYPVTSIVAIGSASLPKSGDTVTDNDDAFQRRERHDELERVLTALAYLSEAQREDCRSLPRFLIADQQFDCPQARSNRRCP
jgi:hypothetical protein